MTTATDSNSFAAKNAITVLRFSRQKDAWLSRRIDFVRGMFDLAYAENDTIYVKNIETWKMF